MIGRWSLLGVVALLLALPALFGFVTERQVRAQVAQAGANAPVRVQVRSYERGWFRSTLVYELGPLPALTRSPGSGSSADQKNKQTLELRSQLQHGPIGVQHGLFFGLFRSHTVPAETNTAIAELVRDSDMPFLFEVLATTGFAGATTFELRVPAVDADAASLGAASEQGSVRFSGMTLRGRYDWSSRAIALQGGFTALQIAGEEALMTVADMDVAMDVEALTEHLWQGPAQLSLGQFDLRSKGAAPNLAAAGVRLQATVSEQVRTDGPPGAAAVAAQRAVTLALRCEADRLQLPGSQVTALQLELRASDLSVAALEAYSARQQVFGAAAAGRAGAASGEAAAIAYQLLQGSPSLQLQPLALTYNGEAVQGELVLGIDSSALPVAQLFKPTDAGLWLQLLQADGELSMSKALGMTLATRFAAAQIADAGAEPNIDPAEVQELAQMQAPLLLQTLSLQGLLREQGDQFNVHLRYGNAELQINDQAMPLGALLQ